MKNIKRAHIIVVIMMIVIPVIFINFKSNSVSAIDNRLLTEWPLSNKSEVSDYSFTFESYFNDRIGFRDEMINANIVLNDKLFHQMEHPSYSYGKDGYVFSKFTENNIWDAYKEEFSNFIIRANTYCKSRNKPFYFVIEPAKASVVKSELPNGYNYNDNWTSTLQKKLQKNNINYVDNITLLKKAYKSGKKVYNIKYDANHWNYLGAYYGVNNLIDKMKMDFPELNTNSLNDFNLDKVRRKSLLASRFHINESETVCTLKNYNKIVNSLTNDYKEEIIIDKEFPDFQYLINKKNDALPRVLVFQGSYMNGKGMDFMANSFGEYIFIHDYQNVINMDYYINIFNPDCIVFEVAENMVNNTYFDYDKLKAKRFNTKISRIYNSRKIGYKEMKIIKGKKLMTIKLNSNVTKSNNMYLSIDSNIYDIVNIEGTYLVTLPVDNNLERKTLRLIYR